MLKAHDCHIITKITETSTLYRLLPSLSKSGVNLSLLSYFVIKGTIQKSFDNFHKKDLPTIIRKHKTILVNHLKENCHGR